MASKQDDKLYIGGLPSETTDIILTQYFEKFGEVIKSEIKKDIITGKPRGFGYVTFADSASLQDALQAKEHMILERLVDVKIAIPKALMKSGLHENNRLLNENMEFNPKKIFVGGLPIDLSEEEFKEFFEKEIGKVSDATLLYNENKKNRGFGFVIFESEKSAKLALKTGTYRLNDQKIEVKQAEPEKPKANNNVKICNVSRVKVTQTAPEMTMPYYNVQPYYVWNNGLVYNYPHYPYYNNYYGGYSYNLIPETIPMNAPLNDSWYFYGSFGDGSLTSWNHDEVDLNTYTSFQSATENNNIIVNEIEEFSTLNDELEGDNYVADTEKKEDVDQTSEEYREITLAW